MVITKIKQPSIFQIAIHNNRTKFTSSTVCFQKDQSARWMSGICKYHKSRGLWRLRISSLSEVFSSVLYSFTSFERPSQDNSISSWHAEELYQNFHQSTTITPNTLKSFFSLLVPWPLYVNMWSLPFEIMMFFPRFS